MTSALPDTRAATILRAVTEQAHDLGAITVAEGIEDAATAARMRQYDCDVAHGYYHSPPVTAAAILEVCCRSNASDRARTPAVSMPRR